MTVKSSLNSSEILTPEIMAAIRDNMAKIRSALSGYSVTLMAATKTVHPDIINYAINECGLTDIGENRVQELLSKYDSLDLTDAKLHFIGTLQANKVKYIVGKVCLIHSLDSLKLAEEISRRSEQKGIITDVLCEINIGNESAKSGIAERDTENFLDEIRKFSGIRPRGIMVIGPHCDSKDEYRPFFGATSRVFNEMSKKGFFADSPILSMGMSDNYDLAAEYGATIVRPGTAIFGGR